MVNPTKSGVIIDRRDQVLIGRLSLISNTLRTLLDKCRSTNGPFFKLRGTILLLSLRTANIALLKYADGERRYIIAPKGVHAGDPVMSGPTAPIKPGNTLALRSMPVGSVIHCVELKPGKGAQMVRSAGGSCQLVAREGAHATLRMRSGEMRRVLSECRATLGEVGNSEHSLRSLGKAGAQRWRGVRPTVRGVAMNPVDHPHGGGEGKTSGGRHPVSPWGMPTKGHKTRKNKRTDSLIVRRRGKR